MRSHAPRKVSGFTLIELLIIVACLGILVAIGVPQYQSYAAKAKISGIQRAAILLSGEQDAFHQEMGRFIGKSGTTETDVITVTGEPYRAYRMVASADGQKGRVELFLTSATYPGSLTNQILQYNGSADVYGNTTWSCEQPATEADRIASEYLPSDCTEISDW